MGSGTPQIDSQRKASVARLAVISRKPSIAVLPFANLSKEPDDDYFSYGLTEDVIRLLARNRWLDVLSRHSAVAFQGGAVPIRGRSAPLWESATWCREPW